MHKTATALKTSLQNQNFLQAAIAYARLERQSQEDKKEILGDSDKHHLKTTSAYGLHKVSRLFSTTISSLQTFTWDETSKETDTYQAFFWNEFFKASFPCLDISFQPVELMKQSSVRPAVSQMPLSICSFFLKAKVCAIPFCDELSWNQIQSQANGPIK